MHGVRGFFHWKYSGVLIPAFFSLAVAMAIGAAAEAEAEAARLLFGGAYVFLALALVWSLGFWLTSNTAHRLWKRKRARRSARAQHYGASLLILFAFIACTTRLWRIQDVRELSLLHGTLIPAHDPMPTNPCSIVPDGAVRILLGTFTSYTQRFPHTVIRVDGEPRLVLDRNTNGSIAVSVDIFDRDGKIIAELDRNHFKVSERSFKVVRKDRSSLLILDEYKKEVLNVRYLNREAIWMNAVLHYPNSRTVILRGPDGGTNCIGGALVADIAIEP